MFDKISDLKNIEVAQEQLNFSLQYFNSPEFIFTLYNIAIAQGFLSVAEKAGLSREGLYKILQPHSKPYFETINKILNAMDLELEIKPIKKNIFSPININNIRSHSLASQYPQISSEWNIYKNGILSPSDVIPNSRKKVWWKCSNNDVHEWASFIISRTTKGKGCPYCEASKVLEKLNNTNL